ncbi:MAG: uridine monophosphate synthetase [bacterium]|jgi:uridine monophosphate synthetase
MKNKIIDALISIQAIKFGEFTLKSGIQSPIYIDLRIIISAPELLRDIAKAMIQMSKELNYERIAGIPYTALPIATAYSLESNVPMIYCRKEVKKYGTGKQIEGIWEAGQQVLVIDDLITNGESKMETFEPFEQAGLKVKDVVVLIDREQGGKERLEKQGYNLYSLISVYEILDRMKELNKISEEKYQELKKFIDEN